MRDGHAAVVAAADAALRTSEAPLTGEVQPVEKLLLSAVSLAVAAETPPSRCW